MQIPNYTPIQPGSTIGIVAPASPSMEKSFNEGLEILAKRYQIKRFINEIDRDPLLPYLAANDRMRIDTFNQAIRDPDIEAIIFSRGGYGSMRLLERGEIDFETLKNRRLPIVGFSDITALHAAANQHGIVTLHGPVVNQLSILSESDRQNLFAWLEGRTRKIFSDLTSSFSDKGVIEGMLIGGNLALLAALAGSKFSPNYDDAILLLEDIGEAPYRIDRLLTQLRLSGAFNQLKAIILGEFIRCEGKWENPIHHLDAKEVIDERLADLGIPLFWGASIGHGKVNKTVPLGKRVRIENNQLSLI